MVVALGGIDGGWFTAAEGAGVGAAGPFYFALARRLQLQPLSLWLPGFMK